MFKWMDIAQKWSSCELIRSKKCLMSSHVFSGVQSISNSPVLPLLVPSMWTSLGMSRSWPPKLNWFGVVPEEPGTLTQAHLISICQQMSSILISSTKGPQMFIQLYPISYFWGSKTYENMVTIPGAIAQAPQPLPRDLPEGRLRLRGPFCRANLGANLGGWIQKSWANIGNSQKIGRCSDHKN